jgi:acyl carrier protein
MTKAEIRGAIVRALDQTLAISNDANVMPRMGDPAGDIRFDELEFDSLSAAEIALTIENETGYVCDLGDFLAFPSVQSLAAHIAAQGPRRPK